MGPAEICICGVGATLLPAKRCCPTLAGHFPPPSGSWALLPWFCTQVCARLSTHSPHSLVPRTCGDPLRPPLPRPVLSSQPPQLPLVSQALMTSEWLHTWPSCLLGATEQKCFILSSELPFGGHHFSPGLKLSVDRQAEAAKPGQAPVRDGIPRSGPLGPAHLCSVQVVGDGTAPHGGVAACHSRQACGGVRTSSGGAACSWCPGKPVFQAGRILECSIWAISVVSILPPWPIPGSHGDVGECTELRVGEQSTVCSSRRSPCASSYLPSPPTTLPCLPWG